MNKGNKTKSQLIQKQKKEKEYKEISGLTTTLVVVSNSLRGVRSSLEIWRQELQRQTISIREKKSNQSQAQGVRPWKAPWREQWVQCRALVDTW